MKLANNFVAVVTYSRLASSSGKRKREHLLLRPPPSPPPQPDELRRSANDVRGDDDNNNNEEEEEMAPVAPAWDRASGKSHCLVSHKQQMSHSFSSTKKRIGATPQASNHCAINQHHPQLEQSTENLSSRYSKNNNNHHHSKFTSSASTRKPDNESTTAANASKSSTIGELENSSSCGRTSVITKRQLKAAGTRRRRFEDLCHYFDFNRMRRQEQQTGPSSTSTSTYGLMASSLGAEQRNNQHDDDHHSHYQHYQQRQTKDQSGRTTSAESAVRTSRRKSELNSFLTILFGSMLAILLLTGGNQIMCGQPSGQQQARLHTDQRQSNMTSPAAPHLATLGLGVNSSAARASTLPPIATESLLVAERDVTLESSGGGARASDDSSSSSSSTKAPQTTGPSSESETTTDEDNNSGDEDIPEPAEKSRLGNLLADTAGDGADLLLNRLQKGQEEGDKATAATGETSSSDEETEVEEGSSTDQPEMGTNTTTSTPASASAMEVPKASGNSTGAAPEGAAAVAASFARPSGASNSSSSSSSGISNNKNQLDRDPENEDELEQTKFALETYARWRAAGDDIIELFSRKLMPIIIEHGYDVDSSTVGGLLQAFNGIRQLKPWALKIIDAWTKLSPGILLGTQSDFGDFDECLNIRVDDPNGLAAANSEHFPSEELDPLTGLPTTTLIGRYCLADVEFPKPARRRASSSSPNSTGSSPTWPYEPIELRRPLLDFAQLPAYKDTIFVETGNFLHMLHVDPIRVGICLTNKIDPTSFQQVFNKILEDFRITINFRGRCVTKYDRPVWTSYQRVSAYVLVVACCLVLLSTTLDLLQSKLNKLPCPRGLSSARLRLQLATLRHRDLITSFSLIRNTRRLFRPMANARPVQTSHHHHHLCTTTNHTDHNQQTLPNGGASSCAGSTSAVTTATTTSSSIADSSVESSPSIERRSSAETTTSSMKDLISLKHDATTSGRHNTLTCLACCEESSHHHQENKIRRATTTTTTGHGTAQVSLQCLHGIRVITMVWMIVNHTYMFGGFFVLWAYRRLIDIAEWPKSLSFQMVLNGWLTVETYFFLSAMIIVLNVLPLMRARKFNYFIYILHRLLRLLPAYIGLVCLNFLWPLISSGPVWLVKGKSFVQEPCEQNLWANFLFINNWFWPEKQCMVHTWFLSADFQLYLMAPVIVYLLYRRPALGHSLNLLVALLASVLSGFVIYANKLLPTTLINKLEFDAIKQQLSYSYFATYQHMGPYCLGLLVGYLLHKRPHARLPKHLTWLLWLLLPPLSFTTLMLTYLWNGAYPEANLINPSPLVSALYVAIHRTIWSSLVAWLVFACATGRAKLLSSFLSNTIFLPISRLSYSIYLVHLPVIMFRALNLRHTIEWTDQNILWEACGNFVVSALLGFFLNVAFESPIINLENVLFGRRDNRALLSSQSSSSSSSSSTQQQGTTIYERTELPALSLGNPDKQEQQHLELQPPQLQSSNAPAAPLANSSSNYSSSSNSSDGRDDSMAISSAGSHEPSSRQQNGTAIPAKNATRFTARRKSLKSEHAASAEQLFGTTIVKLNSPGSPSSGRATASDLGRRRRQQQQQQANAHIEDQSSNEEHGEDGDSDNNNQQVNEADPEVSASSTFSGHTYRRRASQRVPPASRSGFIGNPDDLYTISAEYRHYAPGSYTQWRRALGSPYNHDHHHRQPAASSTSMRSMQYATLARTNRARQDNTSHQPTLDTGTAGRFGRGSEMHHQNRTQSYHFQQQQQYDPLHRDQAAAYQKQFPQSPAGYEDGAFGHDGTMMISNRDQLLFPNSSELNFDAGSRSTLIQQRQQLLASRRRQGRYNTLTGSGSHDWRSQLQSDRQTSQPNQPGQLMNGVETSLLHSLDQQARMPKWLSTSNEVGGLVQTGDTTAGPLLIPRIDWSSTLRRQSRHAGTSLSLAPANHGSLLSSSSRQEADEDDSKIVEEQLPVEPEERSAL